MFMLDYNARTFHIKQCHFLLHKSVSVRHHSSDKGVQVKFRAVILK